MLSLLYLGRYQRCDKIGQAGSQLQSLYKQIRVRGKSRNKDRAQRKHLITLEGQYKYICGFQMMRFTDMLIVARDTTEIENPTADNYAPCHSCQVFFLRKTIYRHKLGFPAITKFSYKE